MKIERMRLLDIVKFTPETYRDNRGRFLESYRAKDVLGDDGHYTFVQGNLSFSSPYVLRGLHYQSVDPQGKLMSCVSGAIFDVAVDMRSGSPTFGQWCGTILDDLECASLWIPPGFAAGFLALDRPATVSYQCTSYYVEKFAKSIKWNDETLGVTWPLQGRQPILSGRDIAAGSFLDAEPVVL